jgi:sulfite oxidase
LAAGKSLEPFWRLYPFHNDQAQVADLLASMRVGTLDAADVAATAAAAAAGRKDDPFAADPPRHPALKVHALRPCNAEVPADLLTDCYLTPTDLWCVASKLALLLPF